MHRSQHSPRALLTFLLPIFAASLCASPVHAQVPAVSIRAPDSMASETGPDPARFSVSRSGLPTADLTVFYLVSGTASNGADYVPLSGSVVIPAGAESAPIIVQPIDDALPEASESVLLYLLTNSAYAVTSPASAAITIQDNDNLPPVVSITAPPDGTILTGPTNILLQAEATDADGWVRSVNFYANGTYIGGSATGSSGTTNNGVPGKSPALFSLVWSNVINGRFTLTARAYDNLSLSTTSTPVVVTVNQDPAMPMIKIVAMDYYAAEPGTDIGTLAIVRTGNTAGDLTVNYRLSGTALPGVDYAALPGSIVLPANSQTGVVQVVPLDDAIPEPAETVTLTLLPDPSYYLLDPRSATVTIKDNDTNTPPSIAIVQPADGTAFKDPSAIPLAVSVSDTDGWVTKVDYYVNGSLLGTATNSPFAFNWASMAPGAYSLTARATDNMGESRTSLPVVVSIDRTPMVRFTITDAYAAEPGDDTATVQVYRYNNTNVSVTVGYTIGGNATPGVDYEALSGSVTLPPGITTVPIVIRAIDDALLESQESVTLTLSSNAAYIVTEPHVACTYIRDNETNALPVVALTAPASGALFVDPSNILLNASASDPNGSVTRVDFYGNNVLIGTDTTSPYSLTWAGMMQGVYALTAKATDNLGAAVTSSPVTITVQRTPVVRLSVIDSNAAEPGTDTGMFQISRSYNTNQDVTVLYTVGGTASNGVDYATLSGSVTLPAGSFSVPVPVQPLNDGLQEVTETVTLTLSSNAAYLVGDPRSATVYIKDDETNSAPTVALTAPADGAVLVNPSNIVVTADAADPDGAVVRVDFYANTTLIGSDISAPYEVKWIPPLQGVYRLTARAVDTLGTSITSTPVSVTVQYTPLVRLYVKDALAAEPGADTATIQFLRSLNTNQDLTVAYKVSGTASNGVDYATLPGTITIPAGAFSTELVIQPIDDAIAENMESVVLTLAGDSAYGVATAPSAVVYIRDNETNEPPTAAVVAPADGAVIRDPTNVPITAVAADVDGSIARVSFYANTVMIGSSTTSPYIVRWTPASPGLTTGQDKFALTVRAVDNLGATVTSTPVTVTIVRTPIVQVYATDSRATEAGADPGTFTLYRRQNTNQDVTVRYAVSGTASNGADYALLPGSVSIPAGQVSTTVTVQPVSEGPDQEPSIETVVLGLLPDPTYLISSPTQATVYIYNELFTNALPTVRIVTPTNGATFNLPATVPIAAEASDPDGTVAKVDLLVNGAVVGSVPVPPYTWLWTNTVAGTYTLTARATDNRGGVRVSEPVRITTKAIPSPSAYRYLPPGYVPGVKLLVMLGVSQPLPFQSYTLTETPPADWVVGNISAGGRYDDLNHTVVFGPYASNTSQLLTYDVTPPADATGTNAFAGTLTTATATLPVGGPSTLAPVPPHPADTVPPLFSMSLDEAAAYTAAWKAGPAPTVAGSNDARPAINYASRAGYLWLNGSAYAPSTNYPTPIAPLVWVSTSPTAPGAGEYGVAVSSMPTNFTPGSIFTVTLAANVRTGSVYAIEDRLPYGWAATNVSDAGTFTPSTGCVRWGLFQGGEAGTVTYDVIPSTNVTTYASFVGTLSVDGVNLTVTGVRKTTRLP